MTGSEWTGQIIVRLLPENVNGDYEAIKYSKHPPVSPSLVVLVDAAPTEAPQNSSFDSSFAENWNSSDCACVALDITVSDRTVDTNEQMSINMSRPPNETVDKALQRLGLSLAKKIFKKRKKVRGSKKGPDISYSLKRSDGTEVDVSSQTHCQVWTPCWLQAEQLEITLTVEGAQFRLQVSQCCPPTLVLVKAYEHFGSRLFVGIPLVVTIKSIFASHTIVNWYVGGQRVLQDNSASYTPKNEDVGKSMAVVVVAVRDNCTSAPEAYEFQHIVEHRPRNAILDLRSNFCQPRKQATNQLRVLSYNILADLNAFSSMAQTSLFAYCDAKFIVRERRIPLILHEILQYQADIVCLQEVDYGVFSGILRPVLEHRGYQGFYSTKHGSGEGGAIFWSLDTFEAVPDDGKKSVLIRDLFSENESLADWKSMREVFILLDQLPELNEIVREKLGHILQTVTLTRRDNSENKVVVGNTHLFFHPMASHIRLLQLFVCFHQMQVEREGKHPIIFCGDLNSSPTSGAARLVFDREVTPTSGLTDKGTTWKNLHTFSWEREYKDPADTPADAPQPPTIRLEEAFPILRSGYPELPIHTHYIRNFASTLDYVLVSEDTFQPTACAAMPSEKVLTEHVAMPSEVLPSDHICLVCDLEWKANTNY